MEKTKPAKAKRQVFWRISLGYTAALLFLLVDPSMSQSPTVPNNKPFLNPSGFAATFSTNGSIDLTNEFFQDLGTNGRGCVTCHQPSQGWTVTPEGLQERFAKKGGTDPIFRTNDGSNSPEADVSTIQARRAAYNMCLPRLSFALVSGSPPTLSLNSVQSMIPTTSPAHPNCRFFAAPYPPPI